MELVDAEQSNKRGAILSLSAECTENDQFEKCKDVVSAGHWISVVSHLDARYGGLSAVVPRLASEIASVTSFKTGVAAFCAPGETSFDSNDPHIAVTTWPNSRGTWMLHRTLMREFIQQMSDVSGIHVHGLWEQSTNVGVRTSRRLAKPYVLSAHGMLDQWALKNKKLKKAIYATFIERRNVQEAACLHALTLAEADDYRRFGCKGPIAVVPNGVAIPEETSNETLFWKFPSLRGKRIVLFLGRVHFKKGLDVLIEAWAAIAKKWPEAQLVIAGPDFEDTQARVEVLIEQRQLSERVLFTGMLRGNLKWSALQAAECFILPSYSEGLSVSTLEAMGVGCPVIVSEQCNLPDVRDFETGWIIQPVAEEIAHALNQCLENSTDENRKIGERGRQLVKKKYGWPSVARQMSEVYRWVQGGEMPRSVEILRS